MANVTIGQLSAATVINNNDLVLIEQSGISKNATMSLFLPPGFMGPFAGSSVPIGWLLCNGQAVSRATYSDLFAAIGETWGVGDGTTTFNVPDMRESAPVGAGTYSAVAGTTHGTITAHDPVALGEFLDDQMQEHVHAIPTLGVSGSDNVVGSISSNHVVYTAKTQAPIADPTNGTPRTGTVTRGKIIGVNFIIKY